MNEKVTPSPTFLLVGIMLMNRWTQPPPPHAKHTHKRYYVTMFIPLLMNIRKSKKYLKPSRLIDMGIFKSNYVITYNYFVQSVIFIIIGFWGGSAPWISALLVFLELWITISFLTKKYFLGKLFGIIVNIFIDYCVILHPILLV